VQPTLKVSPRKYDASVEDLYVWLCGKKNLSGPQQSLCKRHELMKGVSTETPLTERASIYKKLREYPITAMVYQSVTAEYCNIGKNIDKSVCINIKVTREERELHAFACAAEASLWCKQHSLREKLKATDVSKDAEARKQLLHELQALSIPDKKDPGSRKRIAKEIADGRAEATKRFCAQPTKSSYRLCTVGADSEDNSYSYDT